MGKAFNSQARARDISQMLPDNAASVSFGGKMIQLRQGEYRRKILPQVGWEGQWGKASVADC